MNPANEEQPRRWAIRIAAQAEADIIAAQESLSVLLGPEKADRWQERLEAEIAGLATLPGRGGLTRGAGGAKDGDIHETRPMGGYGTIPGAEP